MEDKNTEIYAGPFGVNEEETYWLIEDNKDHDYRWCVYFRGVCVDLDQYNNKFRSI